MKNQILLLCLLSFAILKINAQCTPDLGTGDGKDISGHALGNILLGNYTLDSNGNFNSTGHLLLLIGAGGNNVLNFHNFTLNYGHIFSVNDVVFQGPLVINCTGKATIAGTLDLSGKNGANGANAGGGSLPATAGGAGGPCGGTAGGNGGASQQAGVSATSFGSFNGGGKGGGGTISLGGGGGGGGGGSYGMSGAAGTNGTNQFGNHKGGAAGTIYGDTGLTTLYLGTNLLGGSGGGGGGGSKGNPDASSGGAGGGGGGAIQLSADSIEMTYGIITVAGGNGGSGTGGCPNCNAHAGTYATGGGGGGGSGGTVFITYSGACINCIAGSSININGGTGGAGGNYSGSLGGNGGNGGQGRYLLTQLCAGTTVGIEKKPDDIGTCYPNPASEAVNFVFPSEQNETELKLFDITGREVKNLFFSGKQLTLNREHLSSGVYVYKLISENKMTGSGKLIIM